AAESKGRAVAVDGASARNAAGDAARASAVAALGEVVRERAAGEGQLAAVKDGAARGAAAGAAGAADSADSGVTAGAALGDVAGEGAIGKCGGRRGSGPDGAALSEATVGGFVSGGGV